MRKELEVSGIQDVRSKHKQNWINHLERTDNTRIRNTTSTTNLEEEDIVDALGNDCNASMPEQVNRPNPRRKMLMMMLQIVLYFIALIIFSIRYYSLHSTEH
jgi:hypothetical protein